MEWRDQGILLSTRRHGEANAIIEVFTPEHGRHLGVVRGGAGRKTAPILQPGAQLDVAWRARLEDHLGTYSVEPLHARAADVLQDRTALAGLNAVLALLSFTLPEREAFPALYQRSHALLDMLSEPALWPLAYAHWELALLEEMGFGLDLSVCALSGETTGLAFVSPKTGRAVTEAAAGIWKERLLPLPACLQKVQAAPPEDIAQALRVTGHFLSAQLAPSLGNRPLPAARARFVDRIAAA